MRTLVVEDDDRIADFLVRALHSEGYTCVRCEDGREGLALGQEGDFDLILLDLVLPGMHGLNICQELRLRGNRIPIIMLSALDSIDDVINGLRMGADDYIKKPFNIDELLARIETVLRRGEPQKTGDDIVTVGHVTLNRNTLEVTARGKPVDMTAKEIAVLELLMSKPGHLFSRERILSNVWGYDMDPLTNVVDVYIGKLRRKLDGNSNKSLIETKRGRGYRMAT